LSSQEGRKGGRKQNNCISNRQKEVIPNETTREEDCVIYVKHT
jgi:hypothetical protein